MATGTQLREKKRIGRHRRGRKKVHGTKDRPRLCIHRSLNNFYAQFVDDEAGKVLFGISTLDKEVRAKIKHGGNIQAASLLGEIAGSVGQEKGIKKVCFDCGGYRYHGCVKAFADAARKSGLEF